MGRKRKRINGVPKNGQFWETLYNNELSYHNYIERLTELSICMFDWKGLPETVDTRFLELCLFMDGMCVFFYDEVLGFLTLQVMIGGRLDVYRIPVERTAFATNGYFRKLDNTDSVIIFNNLIHTNSVPQVYETAKRLYEFDRTIDVNVKAQKTPILISCEESQRLTMKNLYMQYDGNEPFIFGDKNLNPNVLKAISTEAPFIADKIYQLKTQYWNEILTYLGITNVNTQKKERLITDEVLRNLGGTVASRESRLKARQQACKQINDIFGLNVSCEFAENFDTSELDNADEPSNKTEGNDNE